MFVYLEICLFVLELWSNSSNEEFPLNSEEWI